MKTLEFTSLVESEFKSKFPNGYINFSKGCLGKDALCITIGLIGDKNDCPNNIRHNDPMLQQFWIHRGASETMSDKVVLEKGGVGATLGNLKTDDKYMYCESVKCGFRKKTGSPKQVIDYLIKYFGKCQQVVKDNQDRFVTPIPEKYHLL